MMICHDYSVFFFHIYFLLLMVANVLCCTYSHFLLATWSLHIFLLISMQNLQLRMYLATTMMATAVFKYSSKFRNLIGDRIEGSGCTPTKGLRISTVRTGVGAYPAKSSKINSWPSGELTTSGKPLAYRCLRGRSHRLSLGAFALGP